ncbi:MAG: hypothetical protein GF334_03100 [Candidatus Altiarchaeales archaeon]|nr:hypothetical protein [Candidatus Altiarchaeales archaeon]
MIKKKTQQMPAPSEALLERRAQIQKEALKVNPDKIRENAEKITEILTELKGDDEVHQKVETRGAVKVDIGDADQKKWFLVVSAGREKNNLDVRYTPENARFEMDSFSSSPGRLAHHFTADEVRQRINKAFKT